MNLVGKIFVVVISVMALVFMALTMAVYTAQRNWRDVVMAGEGTGKEEGLKSKLEKALRANEELTALKAKLEKEYATEKSAKQQALTKLETELLSVQKEHKSLEAGMAGREKDKRDLVAAMKATQTNATDYRQELEKQRTDLIQAQKDRDKHFAEVVKKTDELNQAVNDKETLRKRMADLTKDLAKADEEIRWFHLPDKNSDYKSKTPPDVSGHVVSVNGDGLIEISIGSDQGLRVGHQLQVYRKNTYVGRVEVVKTEPSKSVCKIDKNMQNSNVMENDNVGSKIE